MFDSEPFNPLHSCSDVFKVGNTRMREQKAKGMEEKVESLILSIELGKGNL